MTIGLTKENVLSGISEQQPCLKGAPGSVPMVFIVGSSGSGKTTLIERLTQVFTRNGVRVGTIKHDLHGFEMDRPGKDTWRHKQAGAVATIISSPKQIGMVRDVDHDHAPDELACLIQDVDVILVEGYKSVDQPKIEVFRPVNGKLPSCRGESHLLAVVSDVQLDWEIPCFLMEKMEDLAGFIMDRFAI